MGDTMRSLPKRSNHVDCHESRPGERGLSSREAEVLRLIADGYSGTNIAAILSISQRTVQTYRVRLAAKTGARTTADLTKLALQLGLCELPPR
ncbi:MAG TPA: helix-turn-helix transcriptional regulator [Polyangia bacterium]